MAAKKTAAEKTAAKKTAAKKTAAKKTAPALTGRKPPALGKKAPDFSLESTEGHPILLSDYRGKWVVLYFYPKDNTPGCTLEAKAFRDAAKRLAKLGAVVLGVSKDSVRSHERFRDKYELGFPLLSDPEQKVLEAYGAWGEKRNYGRVYQGIIRSTFLIDPQGRLVRAWPNVRVAGHVDEVLDALEEEASR